MKRRKLGPVDDSPRQTLDDSSGDTLLSGPMGVVSDVA